MLVSHRHSFIFLKTRKTASSAVEMSFEPFARPQGWTAPEGVAPFDTPQAVTEAGIVGARGQEAKREDCEFIDHALAKDVRRRLGRAIWSRYFKFCTIRNPWDKAVSRFHFRRPHVQDLPDDELVSRFREWLKRTPQVNFDDREIYCLRGRPAVDDVVRYENLAEDVARVAERLGVEPLPLRRIHSEHRTTSLHYTDYYDDASRRYVAGLFADEIAHFGWQFDNSVLARRPQPQAKRGVFGLRWPGRTDRLEMAGT